jgi:hypothetical protein
MEYAFDLTGGSTAVIKRYQVAATKATAGVPVLVGVAAGSGLVVATTTSTAKAVGVTVDTSGTYVTAQQTDNSDTERSVGVILSPTAVYRMLMNGGATEGTAMVLHTAASGGSDGLTIVSDVNTDSPELANGTCFCLSGANVGIARKITSNATTTMTFVVPWPRDVNAGDTFVVAPYTPVSGITLQLTTLLTQADASIAVATGAAFKTIELEFRDASMEGRSNSYVYAMLANHVLAATLADS